MEYTTEKENVLHKSNLTCRATWSSWNSKVESDTERMNGCPCKENSVIQEGKPQDGGIVTGKFMQLL